MRDIDAMLYVGTNETAAAFGLLPETLRSLEQVIPSILKDGLSFLLSVQDNVNGTITVLIGPSTPLKFVYIGENIPDQDSDRSQLFLDTIQKYGRLDLAIPDED